MTHKLATAIGLLGVLALLVGCGEDAIAPEQRIRQLHSEAVAAAEAKDVSTLKDMVADGFKSDHLDKSSVLRLVQLYMLGHKSIHIFALTRSVQIVDEDNATAKILVAIAGQPIERADQLFDLNADLLRFDVVYMRLDEEWKVVRIKWRRALVGDFLS